MNPMAPSVPITCDLSIVVPVLNEEDSIDHFIAAIAPIIEKLGLSYEIIFIDDGSTDATVAVVEQAVATNSHVRLVKLTRNFGKEAAMTAGLEWSSGAAVIPMDVDLQDPPELIAEFVDLWRKGFEVVYGQRVDRSADTGTKRATAGMFYRVFNAMADRPIEPNVGDFRLMSRPAVEATLLLRERNRFMKGLFAWVGFKTAAVPYARPERQAGTTKFNYWKLWNFALDGITSFSTMPLKVWTYVGVGVAGCAVVYTILITLQTLLFGRDVPGYASIMVVMLLLGAVQLVSLGIMGEYIGRLYIETKQRPIYLVRDASGFTAPSERVQVLSREAFGAVPTAPDIAPGIKPDIKAAPAATVVG